MMMTRRFAYLAVVTLALALPAADAAEGGNAAEAKLRDSLRNTMLQMRTLQADRDNLQAEKEAVEAEKKALTEKLEALNKESTANQLASEKALTEVRAMLAKKETDNTYLANSVDKWKTAYK